MALRLLGDDEIAALPAPEPLVDGVIGMETLAVLFAPPAAGKSFMLLDLALSVASGSPWLGRGVRQGLAIYIAAEGAAGLGIRVEAWKRRHGLQGRQGVYFLTEGLNLLHRKEVATLLEAVAALPDKPVLVLVDTLARCMVGGDENSAKDVGLAIAALDLIRTTLGATVLLAHHTGKNAETERGSSALRAAADTMLALSKDGDRIALRCDKQKNAMPFDEIDLRLVPVPLDDGETSCILELGTPAPEDLTGNRLKALRALVDLFDDEGATWNEWCKNAAIPESSFRRVTRDLCKVEYVSKPPKGRGGKYSITATGKAALSGFTAKASGGDFGSPTKGFSSHRHSPPPHGHGGDRQSQPPTGHSFRSGRDGGDGEQGDRR